MRPRPTLDALAAERSVRLALLLTCLPLFQVWANMLLHAALGLDWLGTRSDLTEPTLIVGYGYVPVGLEHWVPIFAGLLAPILFLQLVAMPGMAHLLSRLWGGQGTFDQTLNTLAFAMIVPNLVIGATSEWLFSAPMDLLSGHDTWWVAAMHGEFGPLVGTLWNAYVIGVYIGVQWAWAVVLGTTAIRSVQRIPAGAATSIMVVSFALWQFVLSAFVR